MDDSPRLRILEAALACVSRYGIAKTTVEDVAREADLGRATVYRHFPGGREQVISETIGWEVGRFFVELSTQVEQSPEVATRFESGLLLAHAAVAEHALLQKVLETEPERLLPHLTTSGPLVQAALRDYFATLLADAPLADGVTAPAAADFLARMFLSFIVGQGGWDLADPVAVHRLVHAELLAGVLHP